MMVGLTPQARWLLYYGWPLGIITAVVAVTATSDVGIKLGPIEGNAATGMAYTYVAVLIWCMFDCENPIVHRFGALLGALVWVGRAQAFALIIWESRNTGDTRWDLTGSVAERLALAVGCVAWHVFSAWRAGLTAAMQEREASA